MGQMNFNVTFRDIPHRNPSTFDLEVGDVVIGGYATNPENIPLDSNPYLITNDWLRSFTQSVVLRVNERMWIRDMGKFYADNTIGVDIEVIGGAVAHRILSGVSEKSRRMGLISDEV